MGHRVYIAGDWGSTHLRLYLCQDGVVLDRKFGPGALALQKPAEETFFELAGPWLEKGPLPIWLCGMIGARNIWVEAPYAACPLSAADLAKKAVRLEARGQSFAIIPGLACDSPLGGPDTMRSEETQILGALAAWPELASGRRVIAMPGTHTKWVIVEDGKVQSFLTSPVGEIFALLRNSSTLSNLSADTDKPTQAGFDQGLARLRTEGGERFLHLAFQTRTRQVIDGLSKADALGFLSGLLIGADVAAARSWIGDIETIDLIGDAGINALYTQALAAFGLGVRDHDGETCALAGFHHIISQSDCLVQKAPHATA